MASTSNTDSKSICVASKFTTSESLTQNANGEDQKSKLLGSYINKNPDLLLRHAENGEVDDIKLLILCGANVNYEKEKEECRAVDLAWKSKHFEIVLILLENDSVFPKGFKLEDLSDDEDKFQKNIKELIKGRKELHDYIKKGDLKNVEDKIEKYLKSNKLKLYLNEENESAVFTAVYNEQYNIYGYLQSKGADFKDEIEQKVILHLPDCEKQALENDMIPYFHTHSQAHIYSMLSKTGWQHPVEKAENIVHAHYEDLVKVPEIKTIFNVMKYAHYVTIIFDLLRKDVACISPTSSDPKQTGSTTGLTRFKEGRIYVAAHPDRGEKKIRGTIAHELTHMLMEILYRNDCNPYTEKGIDQKTKFDEIERDIQLRRKSSVRPLKGPESKNLLDAFVGYSQSDFHSELIARVSEILVEHDENGRTWLIKNVPELYTFYIDVIKTCETFIKESFLLKPKTDIRSLNESIGEINEIKNFHLYFEKDAYLKIKLSASQNRKKVTVISTKNIRLTTIKVLQKLYDKDYLDLYDNYLVLKFNVYNGSPLSILQTFLSEASKILVIEYYQTMEYQNEGFSLLQKLLELRPNKTIIFIADKSKSFQVKKYLQDEGFDVFEMEDEPCTLLDLIQISQKKILQRELIFSGRTMTLGDLIGENNKELLRSVDGHSILELLNEEKIRLGSDTLKTADLEGAHADFVMEIADLKKLVDTIKNSKDIFIFNAIKGLNLNFHDLNTNFGNAFQYEMKYFADVDSQSYGVRSLLKKRCVITITSSLTIDKFKEICHKYKEIKIYWINVESKEGKLWFFVQQFYNPKFYLSRNFILLRELVIQKEIIAELVKSDLSQSFIFSNLNERSFMKMHSKTCSDLAKKNQLDENCKAEKILFFEEEEDARLKFEENKLSDRAIHWLKWDEEKFIWNYSTCSLEILRPYFDEGNEYEIKEENLIDEIRDKKIVIIADDPGMGKSTTLTKLYESESISKTHWIIRLNLKDHLPKIKDLSLNKISRVDFLLTGSTSTLARRLFEYALVPQNMSMPLLIAFDGFDELLEETDRRTIVMLLKYLKEKTSCKIWITTRVHHKDILGNELSTLAIKFVALDDPLKKEFIKNYLADRFYFNNKKLEGEFKGKQIDDIKILSNFLTAIRNIFLDDLSRFIGTPLQLQLMLECYSEDFEKYDGKADLKFNWNENILKIYQKFITKKYDVFFKKINLETSVLADKQWKTILNQYNKDLVKVLVLNFDQKKFLHKFKDIGLLLGLMRSSPEELDFIHPTFRDYFAAKIFFGWIKKCKVNFINCEKLEYLFTDAMVRPVFKLTRNFMGLKLRNMKMNQLADMNLVHARRIIKEILKEWGKSNKELFLDVVIKEDNTSLFNFIIDIFENTDYLWEFLNLTNGFGQPLLFHVLEKRSKNVFESILDNLLQKRELSDIRDEHQRTPLHFAVMNGNTEILEIIFKKIPKHQRHILFKVKDDKGSTLFHSAVGLRGNKVVKLLLEKMKENENWKSMNYCYDLLCTKDDANQTPMHIAASAGDVEVVKLFLDELENSTSIEERFDVLCMMNKFRQTPILCVYNHTNVIQLIQEKTMSYYYESKDYILSDEDKLFLDFQYLLSKNLLDIQTILRAFKYSDKREDFPILIKEKRNELLITAAKKGKQDIVQFLIECQADVTYSDGNNVAIDYAWENKHYRLVLLLLKADSIFPPDFRLTQLHDHHQEQKDLKAFAENRDDLHRFIKEGNLDEVVNLALDERSKFYLNTGNKSAALTAIENKRFDIYVYLKAIGASFKKDEDVNEEVTITESSETHIYYLISKSRATSQVERLYDKVKSYYERLNCMPEISIILKVLQCADYLDIVFDFNRRNVFSVKGVLKGSDHGKGNIYIAVNDEENQQQDVILRQIVHEFTHFAMEVIFQNDCAPYDSTDEESRNLFNRISTRVKYVANTEGMGHIFLDIFNKHYSENFDAELIIAVLLTLLQYEDEGREWLKENFPDLINYFHKTIIPKCEEMIKNLHASKLMDPMKTAARIKLKKINMRFKNIERNDLFEKTRILLFEMPSIFLGMIKILQTLFGSDYNELNTYVVYEFDFLYEDHIKDIELFFQSEEINTAVIRCLDNYFNLTGLEAFCTFLSHILPSKPVKRVVFLVTLETGHIIMDALEKTELAQLCTVIKDNTSSLYDLDEKSQKMILEKHILFQGNEMKLSDLIGSNEDLHKLIKGEVIENLLSGIEVNLGIDIFDISNLEGAYIHIIEKIDVGSLVHNILNGNKPDHVFLIHDLGKSNMREKCIAVLNEHMDDDGKNYFKRLMDEISYIKYKINEAKLLFNSNQLSTVDFRTFCKNNARRTIYLIEFNNDDITNPFTLRTLYNPNFYLQRKFRVTSESGDATSENDDRIERTLEESKLITEIINKKVVVLFGYPGMGKTTTLTKLYQEKTIAECHWIIRINLSQHSNAIRNAYPSSLNIESVIKFLQQIQPELKAEIPEKLLELALHPDNSFTKRLILVFDEFDCLFDLDREKIMSLFTFLVHKTSSILWIATRSYYQSFLVQKISKLTIVINVDLLPIDFNTKIILMENYLRNRELILNKKLFDQLFDDDKAKPAGKLYTEALLRKLESIFPRQLSHLLESSEVLNIGMQIFWNHHRTTTKNVENLEFPDIKNIFEFYERFIDMKFDIYFKNKNIQKNVAQNKEKQILEQYLRDLAESILRIPNKPHNSENYNLLLGTGLVQFRGGTFEFIHRSFQDYYSAEAFIFWITDHITRNELWLQLDEILKIFKGSENKTMRTFINFLLQRNNLESHENLKRFGEIIFDPTLQDCIRKGRFTEKSALHVAVEEGNDYLFRLLWSSIKPPQSAILLKLTDNENQTLLACSIINENFEIFKILLTEIENTLSLDEQKDIILNKETENGSILNEAAINNNLKIVRFLLEKLQPDIQRLLLIKTNENAQTALHLAVSKNYPNVVEELLQTIQRLFLKNDEDSMAAFKYRHENSLLTMKFIRGQTILHITAENNYYDVLKLILEYSEDILGSKEELHQFLVSESEDKQTALHLATEKGHLGIVKLLLETESTEYLREFVMTKDKFNKTAFHLAIENDFFHISNFMLEKVNTVLTPEERRSFLTMASENINNAFYLALCQDNMEEVEKLFLKEDTKLPERTQRELLIARYDSNRTALNVAVMGGYLDLSKLLLKKAQQVLTREELVNFFLSGENNLALAVNKNRPDLLEFLLSEGDQILQFSQLISIMKSSNALLHPNTEIRELILKRIQYKN